MGISNTKIIEYSDNNIRIVTKKKLKVIDFNGPFLVNESCSIRDKNILNNIIIQYGGDSIKNIKIDTVFKPVGIVNEFKASFDNTGSLKNFLRVELHGEKYTVGSNIINFKEDKIIFVSDCIEIYYLNNGICIRLY